MSVNMQVSALTGVLRANFFQAWKETAAPAKSDAFVSVLPSTTRIENYVNWGPVNPLTEWDGSNDYGTSGSFIYSIENKPYRAAHMIRLLDMDDDQSGGLAQKPKELSVKAKLLPQREVLKCLMAGTNNGVFATDGSSYGLTFDGLAMFANRTGTGATPGFGIGNNSLTQYTSASHAGGDNNTYNLFGIYHGPGTESLKPLIWQQRSGPDFRTNVGSDQSDESMQCRMWATIRGRAAYGMWFNSVYIQFLGLPNQAEMHDVFAKIEAAFRSFQMPKARAVTFGEYVHEQSEFGKNSLTYAGSSGLAEVLRTSLDNQWSAQQIGTNTVATTNRYANSASWLVSNFLN